MTTYEEKQRNEITLWKNQEPWVGAKAINYALSPVTWLVGIVVPDAAIRGALEGASWLGEKLTDVGDILRDANASSIDELKNANLEKLDVIANEVHNWAIGLAATEGGGAGLFGLPGMAVDIPFSITFALRTIHKIGLCYGYECKTEQDRQFMLGILSAAGANSQQEKLASLATLQSIRATIAKESWKKIGQKAAQSKFGKEAGIVTIKGLAKQLGINLTKRKALQAIPLVGAAVGASVNGIYIKDIGWAARRLFQERWLNDKYQQDEVFSAI